MFYVARGIVDAHPDSDRPLIDKTFKAILESYLDDFAPGWDILYGARGVLKEPHDRNHERVIPLSTADVRGYLARHSPDGTIGHVAASYPTYGATNCYGAVLICEKEGFDELLQAERVDDRFDVALMSTKGISARAARTLAESLDVPCFTLHDFDKNGFVMAAGFPRAIDLGLRLSDVEELGLQGEMQKHRNPTAARANLLKNGASVEEAEFIAEGRRVELNELPGDEFIAFVERKLKEHWVEKVVPGSETLTDAWRRAKAARKINRLIDRVSGDDDAPPPDDLQQRVREVLEDNPELSWRGALLVVERRLA
jgi:hypothetical protein